MTPRTVKNPDERRDEIIQTAMRLFEENGYEDTAVEDIVHEMGVAKGTFYYYFRSKDEVLKAISDHFLKDMDASIGRISDLTDLCALEKFDRMLDESWRLKRETPRLIMYFHEERNQYLHHDISRQGMAILIGHLTKLVEQGVREGVFRTPYPREAAIAFLSMTDVIGHELTPSAEALRRGEGTEENKNAMLRALDATQHLTERILGMDEGSFTPLQKYRTVVM